MHVYEGNKVAGAVCKSSQSATPLAKPGVVSWLLMQFWHKLWIFACFYVTLAPISVSNHGLSLKKVDQSTGTISQPSLGLRSLKISIFSPK